MKAYIIRVSEEKYVGPDADKVLKCMAQLFPTRKAAIKHVIYSTDTILEVEAILVLKRAKPRLMNTERQIAQAMMDAKKLQEESYSHKARDYTRDVESCLIETCKQNGVTSNFWALLALAMHWWNDVQLWAEDILAEREVGAGDAEETSELDKKIEEG